MMIDRLIDVAAVGMILALVWLTVTRLPYVLGPEACWTSCP